MTFPLPPEEEERLQQLHQYAILDTPREAEFDRVVRLAQRLFDVPVAFISFVDRDRQWFKASIGVNMPETGREAAICAHAILSDDVLIVPDIWDDGRFSQMPCATGAQKLRFYAGAPIILPEGFRLGSVGIMDTRPRQLDVSEVSLLQDLASTVVAEMERRLLLLLSRDSAQRISLESLPPRLRQCCETIIQHRTESWAAANTQLQAEIAQRQQTEMQLRASESKYRLLVERSSDSIVVSDETGQILEINPAAHQMLGYEYDEVMGHNISEFIAPGTAKADITTLEKMPPGQTFLAERLMVRKDGAVVPVEVGVRLLENGLVQATARDITVRKRAETELRELNAQLERMVADRTVELDSVVQQLLREIGERQEIERALQQSNHRLTSTLESINDGFYSLDKEWRFAFVNSAAEVMSGRTREDMIGRQLWEVVPEVLDSHFWEEYQRAVETGAASAFEEYFEPTNRWYQIHCYPSEEGLSVYFQDISERKESEAALQNAKEEAERASEAKTEFLSRMSHELRTPLNAILGFAQLFELDEMEEEEQENIDQILHAGRHLLGLINEVLDVARVESGQVTLSIEPVAIGELTQEVLSLVQTQASERRISLRSAITDQRGQSDDGPYILADRQRLKQVLLNLVSNAIKYNRTGGQVEVSCALISETGSEDWIRIEVSDTGHGIGAAGLKKLFTPFERLGAEQTSIEGTGIGLTLSKRLVELMNGVIGVNSIEGQGSTFWVELPSAEDPAALSDEMVDSTPKAEIVHTVLYIEDNLSNLKLVERIMARRPDIRLIAGMQGGIGIDLAREHRPQLILLDLHLPDMTGSEVMRRLQLSPETREIPVVVLSADATPRQIERLREAGALDYLTKPLNVRKLLAVLSAHLQPKKETNKEQLMRPSATEGATTYEPGISV